MREILAIHGLIQQSHILDYLLFPPSLQEKKIGRKSTKFILRQGELKHHNIRVDLSLKVDRQSNCPTQELFSAWTSSPFTFSHGKD